MKFLALMIMVGVVAVGVFFGLNELTGTRTPAAPPTTASSATAPVSASAGTATPPAQTNASTTDAAASGAAIPAIDEDDLCDADNTAVPAAAAGTAAPPTSAAGAHPAGEVKAAATEAPRAQASPSSAVPATTTESAGAPESAAPEPQHSATEPEAAPPVEARPATQVQIAAKPARTPAAPAARHPVTPSPMIKPAAPAIWWTSGSAAQRGFTLSFAGEASFAKAIVLLFSQPVDAGSASTIRVVGKDGSPLDGNWTVSPKNPNLLVFQVPAGTYVLTVPSSVKSTQGTALGRTFGGPLSIH